MPDEGRPHLFLPQSTDTMPYRPRRLRIEPEQLPERDRVLHGQFLLQRFTEAWDLSRSRREEAQSLAVGLPEPDGIYIQIESDPEFRLALASLDIQRSSIELVAVKTINDVEIATIFIPDSKFGIFLQKIDRYINENSKNGNPKGQPLIAKIANLKLATLESLWTSDPDLFPADNQSVWWEVWLRKAQDVDGLHFKTIAKKLEITVGQRTQTFLDRIVILARATPRQLSSSIDLLGVIAEVRLAEDNPTFFTSMNSFEQGEWISELNARVLSPRPNAPAICLLDTGVNHMHPLITPALRSDDVHSVESSWGTYDHKGHGTEMAGLALYGDLREPLRSSLPVQLTHHLESVKILPPHGRNEPELYGKITAEAIARAEVQAPERQRIVSMSVASATERDLGKPSSWSAELDNLAIGADSEDFEPKRLIITCAGNRDFLNGSPDYFEESLTDGIHSPGQSWNALTVGACTHRCAIQDPTLNEWRVLAYPGDLSPSSTTSVTWERQWPIKPELVFEGGNAAVSPDGGLITAPDDLSLLTTDRNVTGRSLRMTGDTSAATAQIARFAALLQEAYPKAWPETIRALLVHSSEWTPAMMERFPEGGRGAVRNRLRSFGFGIPNMGRAQYSMRNGLTLISQDKMRPYDGNSTKEMKFHRLPWPRQALLSLGETPVKLRVTLSYFIEANPARRGWQRKHRYASHGFRFDLQAPQETEAAFKLRINQKAWEMEEYQGEEAGQSDSGEWLLGSKLRSLGSIHSDVWKGTAADLATRDLLGVFPVIGWWRERYQLGRGERDARYSLLVSIDTPAQSVDLYNLISQQIKVPISVVIHDSRLT